MVQTVSFDVSEAEYEILLDKKGRQTWRELLLQALGIETQRLKPGPRRQSE